jgi:hypothetical protein
VLQFSHIFEHDSRDATWVEMSLDGGPFVTLGTASTPNSLNWYNSGSVNEWRGTSGLVGVWRRARHPLTGSAGRQVQVRWVLRGGPFSDEAGVGVDDVLVFDQLRDVGVTALVSPDSGPDLGPRAVALEISNLGDTPQAGFGVEMRVTGPVATTVTETFTGSLPAGGRQQFAFVQLADFSLPGTYELRLKTLLPGDHVPGNDELVAEVVSQGTVRSFPWIERFETGNGQFITGGRESSWEVGMPAGNLIATAGEGLRAWVTNLDGPLRPSEAGYLQSPPIDCSSLINDPFVSFAHIYDLGSSTREHTLQMAIDGGPYTQVGSVDEPGSTHWYNDTYDDAWTGRSTQSGEWRTARCLLRGAAGHVITLRWVIADSYSTLVGDGIGVDDVRVVRAGFNSGQRPRPGVALLDINDATDRLGFPVSYAVPGPYVAVASTSGDGLQIAAEGEAMAPIILVVGTTSVGALTVPGAGQFDLVDALVLANGMDPTGMNPLFRTNGSGNFRFATSLPLDLVGVLLGFQAAVISNQCPSGMCLTNAVQVTIVP